MSDYYEGNSQVEAGIDDFVVYDADLSISVSENSGLLGDVKLYPNPSSGELSLSIPKELTGELTIELKSVTGALVHKENRTISNPSEKLKLSLPSLQDGIYLLELGVGGQFQVLKFSLMQ